MISELSQGRLVRPNRERLRWGWKLFSGLLSSAATGERDPTRPRPTEPQAQRWRGGKEAIGVLLEGMETKRDGHDSNFTEKRTSCLGKDLGQDRPGGDLPFVVSRSHLCARGLYSRQRALEERAAGGLAPGWGVFPHAVAPQGPLARTGPPPSLRRIGGGQRTPASPRADNPPRTIPRGSLSRRQPRSPRVAQAQPVLEARGAPGVAPALFGQRGAGRWTLTVHPSEEKQEPRRPPPLRLFCAPATGHTHGRWRERGDGGGGAGARRRRRRAPGCSLRAPRRRRGRGGAARARSLPPALRRSREPLAGRPSRGQGRAARAPAAGDRAGNCGAPASRRTTSRRRHPPD